MAVATYVCSTKRSRRSDERIQLSLDCRTMTIEVRILHDVDACPTELSLAVCTWILLGVRRSIETEF